MLTLSAPTGLRALMEELGTQGDGPVRVGRFNTYEVDLSPWNLSLTAANPSIWVQPDDLTDISAEDLARSLTATARLRGWHNSLVILFVDGDATDLRQQLPLSLPAFAIIDGPAQTQIEAAVSPTAAALSIFRQQLTWRQLAPYETSKPVTNSRFFGRQREIDKVMQNPQTSYLFVGIRRIGKTSLLKEIKRRLDLIDSPESHQVRRVYIDCTVISTEEEFLRTLTFQLEQSGLTLLTGRSHDPQAYQKRVFDHYAELHGRPITFLLDEFDRLLAHVRHEWQLLRILRTAVQSGQIRFIMAGFRRAMDAATNVRSPFFNLITPVRLGRLQLSDVRQMVVLPFQQLGITIADETAVVERIMGETAGLPNYVQYYCRILLDQLESQGRDVITVNDLQTVHQDHTFRNFMLNTFMANTELLDQAIVYAIVDSIGNHTPATFSQRIIHGFLQARRLSLSDEQVDRACRNLELAGVFNQVGNEFEFAVPRFHQILRQTRDVAFLFEKTRQELQTEKILA